MSASHYTAMQNRADQRRLKARFMAVARIARLLLIGAAIGAALTAAAMIERGWTEATHMQLEVGE